MASQESQTVFQLRKSGFVKTIGLIADTHIPVRAREIPSKVFKVFEDVDFIIHAGDLVNLPVIDELERLAPVLAVYGNMDGPEIRGKLPKINSLKVFDWKIGVIHNPSVLFGMKKCVKSRSRTVSTFWFMDTRIIQALNGIRTRCLSILEAQRILYRHL